MFTAEKDSTKETTVSIIIVKDYLTGTVMQFI